MERSRWEAPSASEVGLFLWKQYNDLRSYHLKWCKLRGEQDPVHLNGLKKWLASRKMLDRLARHALWKLPVSQWKCIVFEVEQEEEELLLLWVSLSLPFLNWIFSLFTFFYLLEVAERTRSKMDNGREKWKGVACFQLIMAAQIPSKKVVHFYWWQ